jgi:hypothetical protein
LKAAFYCVADERYFLGAVAMLNSLRLHGHREPLYVLDCGLRRDQRELLASGATVVAAPRRNELHPWLAKTLAPTAHPADVMALIDTDMIATRSLLPLLEEAESGRVVAFENDSPRFVPDWGEALDLGEARPGPYVSSGLVVFGGAVGTTALELMDDRQGRVEIERTIFGRDEPGYPFRFPEQDVLNAILRTRIEPAALVTHENRLAPNPPFRGLRLVDLDSVRCTYRDGVGPFVLHHFGRKPWLVPMYHGLYSRLIARLLLGPDLPLRVREDEVPLRMRDGLAGRAERVRVDVVDVFRRYLLRRPAES